MTENAAGQWDTSNEQFSMGINYHDVSDYLLGGTQKAISVPLNGIKIKTCKSSIDK